MSSNKRPRRNKKQPSPPPSPVKTKPGCSEDADNFCEVPSGFISPKSSSPSTAIEKYKNALKINQDLSNSSSISEEDVMTLISELPDSPEGHLAKQIIISMRQIFIKEISKVAESLSNDILTENRKLNDKINVLETVNKNLKQRLDGQITKIVNLETELNKLDQYNRRNNLEISGIPDSVSNDALEGTAIKIFKEIGVDLAENEIEACHRLRKGRDVPGPARTIIRLVNRRKCESALRNKKGLKSLDKTKIGLGKATIYINESLCKPYRTIWWLAKKLHINGKINRFYVSNGTVKIVVKDGDAPISIFHKQDYSKQFPNLNTTTGEFEFPRK